MLLRVAFRSYSQFLQFEPPSSAGGNGALYGKTNERLLILSLSPLHDLP